jgi:hypothetical protein
LALSQIFVHGRGRSDPIEHKTRLVSIVITVQSNIDTVDTVLNGLLPSTDEIQKTTFLGAKAAISRGH